MGANKEKTTFSQNECGFKTSSLLEMGVSTFQLNSA